MTNNIIIFPKNKIENKKDITINKEQIYKQYKELLKQQEEIWQI